MSKPKLLPGIAKLLDEIFELADKNKDGFITEDEVAAHPGVKAVLFAKDANGDGKVTKEEASNAFKKTLAGKTEEDMVYAMVEAQLSGMVDNLKAKPA